MEASAAAPAEAGQPQEGTQTAPEGTEAEQQQTPQVPEELMETVSRLSEQVDRIQPLLEQQPPEPEGGEAEQPEGLEGGYLYNEYGEPVDPRTGQPVDPEELDARQIEQAIEQRVTDAVSKAIQPLVEQQQQQQVAQEAAQLEQEYPELANPEVAGPVVERARQVAEQMGQPELAGDPKFVRLAYLAGKAEQLAAQETPAGSTPEAVQIEGGGGAAPQLPPEEDAAMRIVRAGRPAGNVLPGLS